MPVGLTHHVKSYILYSSLCELTKTLAEVCLFVNEDLSRDDISKGHKHLEQVLVSKLLRQVVNEQVGPLWTCKSLRLFY